MKTHSSLPARLTESGEDRVRDILALAKKLVELEDEWRTERGWFIEGKFKWPANRLYEGIEKVAERYKYEVGENLKSLRGEVVSFLNGPDAVGKDKRDAEYELRILDKLLTKLASL